MMELILLLYSQWLQVAVNSKKTSGIVTLLPSFKTSWWTKTVSNFYENFILYVCFRDGEPSLSEIGRDVRNQVRNEWAHCKVNDWNDLKYSNCFSLMIKFAKTFPDSMKSKVVLIEELTEWQENGLKLVGKYVEPELLRKVFKEYSFILKQIN